MNPGSPRSRLFALSLVASLALRPVAWANDATLADLGVIPSEKDHRAPIDYGFGPGVKLDHSPTGTNGGGTAIGPVPPGPPNANVTGVFGTPVTWPIIAIHVILLPDGRVLSYGSTLAGAQGAMLNYDVWNPSLGTGANAHLILPNTTPTDIFCSGQSVMWQNGDVLITGGDLTIKGARNYARNDTTIFSPTANTLIENAPMTYSRWYGSLVSLPNGNLVVFGGRENQKPTTVASTPEIYNPSMGWQTLPGAASDLAFGIGNGGAWYYPRSYVAPGGMVFVIGYDGNMFWVDTSGNGAITQLPVTTPLTSTSNLPTVAYAPGKLLSLRTGGAVIAVDFTQPLPVVTPVGNVDQVRFWANGTVLADGRVVVTGGSTVANVLTGVDYTAEIWDPATSLWTAGASATIPRLYHSTALLLPDATVLTAGGGAPGPVINLNAEIFYPPYLYADDGSGQPAARPALSGAPAVISVGQAVTAMVGPSDQISRLTLVRSGSATHANNSDQRFIDLVGFTQVGQQVSAALPSDSTVLVPGYYMLFAINQAGVPSVASIVLVTD